MGVERWPFPARLPTHCLAQLQHVKRLRCSLKRLIPAAPVSGSIRKRLLPRSPPLRKTGSGSGQPLLATANSRNPAVGEGPALNIPAATSLPPSVFPSHQPRMPPPRSSSHRCAGGQVDGVQGSRPHLRAPSCDGGGAGECDPLAMSNGLKRQLHVNTMNVCCRTRGVP